LSADLIIFYIFLTILGILFFIFNLIEIKSLRRDIGKISLKWSYNFNFYSILGLRNSALLIIYLSYSIYKIIKGFQKLSSFKYIFFLILFFSFYPKWHVWVGSKGMIIGRQVILWEMLKDWKITKKGWFKYLEIKYESAYEKLKVRKLSIPNEKAIEDILKKVLK